MAFGCCNIIGYGVRGSAGNLARNYNKQRPQTTQHKKTLWGGANAHPNGHRPPIFPLPTKRVRRRHRMHKIICPAIQNVKHERHHDVHSKPNAATSARCNEPKHQQTVRNGLNVGEGVVVRRRMVNAKQSAERAVPGGIEVVNCSELPQVAAAAERRECV